jgi:hypothetical protein
MRYLSDLGERALRTFIQAYLAAIGVDAGGVPGFDELFTLTALKVAIAATVVSVAMSLLAKPVGNPDSPSALPPQAQVPAPDPPDPTLAPEDAPVVPQVDDDALAHVLGLPDAQPKPVLSNTDLAELRGLITEAVAKEFARIEEEPPKRKSSWTVASADDLAWAPPPPPAPPPQSVAQHRALRVKAGLDG